MVKRWVNEAQEAASSDNIMVQVRMVLDKQTHHTVIVPAPQVLVASGRDRFSSFCHGVWGRNGNLGEVARAAHGCLENSSSLELLK